MTIKTMSENIIKSYSVKSIRKQFAEKGVFYTDEKLAKTLADELSKSPHKIEDVYDPTCGAGNLLAVFPDDVAKYGQEINSEQAEELLEFLNQ